MRQTIARVLCALALFTSASLAAPNFSGHWRLNSGKSKLPESYAGMRQERAIEHRDPELKMETKSSSEDGDQVLTARFTTDGRENHNSMDGDAMNSVVTWDGDALVFKTSLIFDTETVELLDRWTLSGDGKQLTIDRKQKSGNEEEASSFVFDRE